MDTVDKTQFPPYTGWKPRLFLDVGSATALKPYPHVERSPETQPHPYQQKKQGIPIFHILEKLKVNGYIWG